MRIRLRCFCGGQGSLLGPWRGIDHDQSGTRGFGGCEHMGQAGGLCGHHHRTILLSAVAPVTGGGLRVKINDGGRLSARIAATASESVKVVLPVPPFCAITAITSIRVLSLLS